MVLMAKILLITNLVYRDSEVLFSVRDLLDVAQIYNRWGNGTTNKLGKLVQGVRLV